MNPEVAEESPEENPRDAFTQSLIDTLQLSDRDLDRIKQQMRRGQSGFVAAGLHLGLISASDVERAIAAGSADKPRARGIIEAALSRIDRGRSVIPQHSGQVHASNQLIIAHDADNSHSELIRSVRTEILNLHEKSTRSLALTILSPDTGEGRSQLAAELAIAFSQILRPTLLIDADLRNPRQQILFNAKNLPGLSQCLELGGSVPLLGVEEAPNLSLLPAGDIPANPLELLSSRRFERLVADFRHVFDFIIIDSPAASRFADAFTIAQVTGASLVVSRKGTTAFTDLREMLRRIATARSRVMGAVINHF